MQRIHKLRDKISTFLEQSSRAEIIRSGIRLAIFGAPNAGKSSFLNWFCELGAKLKCLKIPHSLTINHNRGTAQREASIVTAHPGTTRDVVEVSLDFHGYPVIVSDTAGLRITSDEVETIGIERAKAA